MDASRWVVAERGAIVLPLDICSLCARVRLVLVPRKSANAAVPGCRAGSRRVRGGRGGTDARCGSRGEGEVEKDGALTSMVGERVGVGCLRDWTKAS